MQKARVVVARRAPLITGPHSRHRVRIPADEPATMSVPDAARLLGISESAAYEASARGEIPTLKIGRRVLVVRQALIEMLRDPRDRSQSS